MSNSTQAEVGDTRILDVALSQDELTVSLIDGRRISVPLAWFPRLLTGTSDQRAKWELAGAGLGIHWPDLDEDISAEGLLRGARPPCKPQMDHDEWTEIRTILLAKGVGALVEEIGIRGDRD